MQNWHIFILRKDVPSIQLNIVFRVYDKFVPNRMLPKGNYIHTSAQWYFPHDVLAMVESLDSSYNVSSVVSYICT